LTSDAWPLSALQTDPQAAKGVPQQENVRSSSYLTFDTGPLGGVGTIVSARLRVHTFEDPEAELNPVDDVLLFGGSQPAFGEFGSELTAEDAAAADQLLDAETMSAIEAQTYAEFDVPVAQVNLEGLSQFALHLARVCADFDSQPNIWLHHRPATADAARRPALHVTYEP
jgi:hypothetical protein